MNNQVYEKDIHIDIMRYKANQSSFLLCVLAIVLNVAMFLLIYTETNCVPNYLLGIDLIINVVFMLAAFLIAEKTKAYSTMGGVAAIILAAIEIGRIFFIPTMYYGSHLLYLEAVEEAEATGQVLEYTGIIGLGHSQFTWCLVLMVGAAVSLLVAGIITIDKSDKLKAHLKRIEGRE
ncbi:MAG: hypothetical protein IJD46_02705 [Bacilli bacterium]|nr:hypothetical protein [Bacilli bacterium]